MTVSYSLASVEASPETQNDRDEIPEKGRLQLCLQELGESANHKGGLRRRQREEGGERAGSLQSPDLPVPRRLSTEPCSQTPHTRACTHLALWQSGFTLHCLREVCREGTDGHFGGEGNKFREDGQYPNGHQRRTNLGKTDLPISITNDGYAEGKGEDWGRVQSDLMQVETVGAKIRSSGRGGRTLK